ncbi:MAG: nicotinamidase [Legionella sp.]|uniref:nicotinamidase n=1 Tax=Legionella sp. TaxID=459 RepID=UPI0039E24E97
MRTLIILDVQNDFISGSLATPHGMEIIPVINRILPQFDLIVATQDWHPQNHQSFASNHPGYQPFATIQLARGTQTLWPEHCVQGSWGSELHAQLDNRPIQAIFRKGINPEADSYSGFYDNYHEHSTGLTGYLHDKGAKELYFCGLCADICVYFSIKDAYHEGFSCHLLEDATKALDEKQFLNIKQELLQMNVNISSSKHL